MANGANRIFKIMQKTNVNTVSEFISLTVKSLKPLTLTDSDKLFLTSEFFTFSDTIDTSKISVGDVFNAFTFNDGQQYYISQVVSSKNNVVKVNDDINSLVSQIKSLQSDIQSLQSDLKSLTSRVSALESKEG
jgi:hypothetical protein